MKHPLFLPPLLSRPSLPWRLSAACALLAAAAAGFWTHAGTGLLPSALAATAEGPAAPATPALTVTTAQPQTASLGLQLSANGNIAAWQEALVGAQSNGLQLREVLVNVGDRVHKGQVLARFATETVNADLLQARATLAEAQANAADAAANAARARSLQNTEALSAQQLTQYLTTESAAQARMQAAQAGLTAQQLRVGQAEVSAPDSGVISARSATVGAVVGQGSELFRLIRQGRLEWRAEVTSSELARLKPGTAVTVTAASGAQINGRVRMIAPTVDPQTRAALVYVDLPPMAAAGRMSVAGPPQDAKAPPGGSATREAASVGAIILPGMFAKGVFELGNSSGLTVPQQSVVIRDGFAYVFRLGPDQRVRQTKVQTGRRTGNRVEVVEGLKPDDTLVASGAGFLNDGDLVKVAPAAREAASVRAK